MRQKTDTPDWIIALTKQSISQIKSAVDSKLNNRLLGALGYRNYLFVSWDVWFGFGLV